MLQNERKIMEAILELNSFLIKYKLKSNKFNGLKDNNSDKNFDNQRIETFKFIVDNFNNFDEIYEKLKNINNKDHLKNFLEIVRNKSKNNFDLVEIPFLILGQRKNYLLGKLAKCCGHFSQALLYFSKSKERQIICDAYLIKSSIKQIFKLIRQFETELEKDNIINAYINKKFNINSLEMPKVKKTKIEEDIQKYNKYKESFTYYYDELNKEIYFFSYSPKDVIILIEYSETMCSKDNKKIERASRNSITILDNYITEEDKFGLFIFTEHVNPIVSLGRKNLNNLEYIKDVISSLENLIEEIDYEVTNLKNALERLIDYFKKKSCPQRQKWVILYTDTLNNESSLKETIKKMEEFQINLLVVALSMNKENSILFSEIIKTSNPNNRNEIIENENIVRLSQIFRINGTIQENEKKFVNERYDCEKDTNFKKN